MFEFPVSLRIEDQGEWLREDVSDAWRHIFPEEDTAFGGDILRAPVPGGSVSSLLVLGSDSVDGDLRALHVVGVSLYITVFNSDFFVFERLQIVSDVGSSVDHTGLAWREDGAGEADRGDIFLGGPDDLLGLPQNTSLRDMLKGFRVIIAAASIVGKTRSVVLHDVRITLHLGAPAPVAALLPPNSTPQERAIEQAAARAPTVAVRSVWDPDTCPANVLPWLAWALSVDQWNPDWPESQKRDVIRNTISVQRRKGTAGAVRDALGPLAIDARVVEWHRAQVPGAPYTYRLVIESGAGAPVASLAAIERALATVDRVKSLRSHLDIVQVVACSTGGPTVGAAAVMGHDIVVLYDGQIV